MNERSQPAVLMVGPALSVRGGVSAVERVLMEVMPADMSIAHVATMVEGTRWRKLHTFAYAAVKVALALRRGDIAHIHFASGASSRRKMIIARLALRRGARVILHAHGGGYRQFWERISQTERTYTLNTLQRVHGVVVLGTAWRDFFVSIGVPRHNIVVLPNPVVLPKHVPERPERASVRFVYLGLVGRSKGAFDLIEAIARLSRETLSRVNVVVAGDGELAELRAFASRLGIDANVDVLEWISPEERDELLASADAFVLPSYAEGLPMALLEAMAWGLPPICTPVGSISEYVSHGVNGLLVQAGAIDELAAAIEHLARDGALRAHLGREARSTVEPLDADVYANRVAAIYDSVAPDAITAVEPEASDAATRQ